MNLKSWLNLSSTLIVAFAATWWCGPSPTFAQITQPAKADQAARVESHDHDHDHDHDHEHHDGHDHDHAPATTSTASITPKMSDDAFAAALRFDKLRALSLQDRQTLKTWDTYSRQTLSQIAGKSKVDGRDPLFTILDIGFSPDRYIDRPILRIKNPQFLSDLLKMDGLDPAQAASIEEHKAVSLSFWSQPATQQFVQKMQEEVIASRDTINQIQMSANVLSRIMRTGPLLSDMSFIAPATGADWHKLTELRDNVAFIREAMGGGTTPGKPLEGYNDEQVAKLFIAVSKLGMGWQERDAATVQQQLDLLAEQLPTIGTAYPSAAKRNAEVLYNKFYKLTLPGAAVYFVAFTLFMVAAYSKGRTMWRWAIAFTVLGLLMHTVGIGIRWWLDQKSTGSWFYSIPIKNQFESVMFSAWFGMLVGLALELWKKKSLFGAAASFVGWLSLVALFTVPYVFGKDIGNEIGRVNGILMSYWLYVHVTLATASYALIGMSFLLGVWWLLRYFTAPPEIRRLSGYRISADAAPADAKSESLAMAFAAQPVPAIAGAGTIGNVERPAHPRERAKAAHLATHVDAAPCESVRSFLATLDSCNVVILQMAFWILGIAIVCGAMWADVSWGRPWGWDPKETFALVTWIVYLVILHVRMITRQKGLWTSILCIVGFFVMLFNWIGVNYFLVGLHSYA